MTKSMKLSKVTIDSFGQVVIKEIILLYWMKSNKNSGRPMILVQYILKLIAWFCARLQLCVISNIKWYNIDNEI